MSGVINDAKKKTQQMAQQVARQIAQEPLEILKDAGKQVMGTPEVQSQAQKPQADSSNSQADIAGRAEKVKQQDRRLLGALEQEISEIRMQKAKAQEQAKVQEQQRQQQQQASVESVPMVTSKRSRRMGAQPQGQKASVERQQKHVESPVQSST